MSQPYPACSKSKKKKDHEVGIQNSVLYVFCKNKLSTHCPFFHRADIFFQDKIGSILRVALASLGAFAVHGRTVAISVAITRQGTGNGDFFIFDSSLACVATSPSWLCEKYISVPEKSSESSHQQSKDNNISHLPGTL